MFEDMAAMVWQDFTVTGNGNPERIAGLRVMASFFPLLGVQPIAGRTFVPAEDRPEAAPTAVLSYGFWQRRFGGDRGLVGRSISLNGAVRTVVGIMPAGFQFPSRQAEVWVPAAFTSRELAERDSHYLLVIARLKATLLSEAEADMAVIARTLEQRYTVSNKDLAGVRVIPLREQYAGGMRLPLAVLLATVGTVLFVACANVAHLLLARGMFRRKEIAMRVALGAGRGRVLRQLVTECLVLAVTGELLGVALSTTSFLFLARLIPESFPQGTPLGLNLPVLAFTTGIALVTAVLFGVGPSLQAATLPLSATLKDAGKRTGDGGHGRLRDALVIAEMTLTVLLLVAAGLLLPSYSRLRGINPGFQSGGVLTAETVLPVARYRDLPTRVAFIRQVLEQVRAMPGVVSAGYVNYLPLTFKGGTVVFSITIEPLAQSTCGRWGFRCSEGAPSTRMMAARRRSPSSLTKRWPARSGRTTTRSGNASGSASARSSQTGRHSRSSVSWATSGRWAWTSLCARKCTFR
ncbi:MAG: hypothetical protein DMF89_01690 [Acidobacteria bacterium]|nr:MAG: hypothetical protein DMF89_01690 [Acidobacteriota bacterium]